MGLIPIPVTMPLAVDFGASNTAAGFYMDQFTYDKIKGGVQQGQISPGALYHANDFFSPEDDSISLCLYTNQG